MRGNVSCAQCVTRALRHRETRTRAHLVIGKRIAARQDNGEVRCSYLELGVRRVTCLNSAANPITRENAQTHKQTPTTGKHQQHKSRSLEYRYMLSLYFNRTGQREAYVCISL